MVLLEEKGGKNLGPKKMGGKNFLFMDMSLITKYYLKQIFF